MKSIYIYIYIRMSDLAPIGVPQYHLPLLKEIEF